MNNYLVLNNLNNTAKLQLIIIKKIDDYGKAIRLLLTLFVVSFIIYYIKFGRNRFNYKTMNTRLLFFLVTLAVMVSCDKEPTLEIKPTVWSLNISLDKQLAEVDADKPTDTLHIDVGCGGYRIVYPKVIYRYVDNDVLRAVPYSEDLLKITIDEKYNNIIIEQMSFDAQLEGLFYVIGNEGSKRVFVVCPVEPEYKEGAYSFESIEDWSANNPDYWQQQLPIHDNRNIAYNWSMVAMMGRARIDRYSPIRRIHILGNDDDEYKIIYPKKIGVSPVPSKGGSDSYDSIYSRDILDVTIDENNDIIVNLKTLNVCVYGDFQIMDGNGVSRLFSVQPMFVVPETDIEQVEKDMLADYDFWDWP